MNGRPSTRARSPSAESAPQPDTHYCLIYENDPAEQLPALVPFIREGLASGEQCVCVADDQTVAEMAAALERYGIDTSRALGTGRLVLWSRDQWRLPGELESARMAAQLRSIIERALRVGYPGVRFGIEMTWTLGPEIEAPRLLHWEATINEVMAEGLPFRMICQYNRRRLSPAAIKAALSTHPQAIIDAEVCDNPYYEAPVVLKGQSSARQADWMVARLLSNHLLEKEREERIRAEAALEEAEASRQRLEELYDFARSTSDDLRNANKAKDEFLALVSHEFRTPVTTVLGNAEILTSRSHLLSDSQRRQALTDIYQEARRLNSLISNLLRLARIEGGQPIELSEVPIASAVSRATAEHQRRYPSRLVAVTCEAPNATVVGNPGYLADVLDNLLGNAEKYSPPGEPMEICTVEQSGEVVVSILDRGLGVRPEEVDSLFDAFFRSSQVSDRVSGLGIGLAVCRRLVEAQNGRIWAHPRPGGGSQFSFALPGAGRNEASQVSRYDAVGAGPRDA